MPTTDTSVPQVIVNKLTKAQYTAATKNPTEFYAVTDEDIYSDFTGATSSTAGAHGLVPAPAAGDQDKFLKGDGTWGTAGGGGAADATLSFSSTNPIQNQAITNTIFDEGTGIDTGKIAGVDISIPYSSATYILPHIVIGGQPTDTPGEGGVSVGYMATSGGQTSVAMGYYAESAGDNSTAVGNGAGAYESDSTAIGCNAYVDEGASGSTALGYLAYVDEDVTNAVALGSNSCAYDSDTVSVGDETAQTPLYRRIVNVADATAAHDAVTKGQLDSATAVMGGATSSVAGTQGLVPAPAVGDQDKYLKGDGTWAAVSGGSGLVEMSYGEANAWAKFIAAYQAGSIVYCRASSNADPSSGTQGRKAFMAYVNNATAPTEVEFQYVRSVSTKTASQPVDQVFVYKLTSASGGAWTVESRNMAPRVVSGTNITVSYANSTYTISAAVPTVVQTTGQSTTSVMSQKAVTDIIGDVETILQTLNSGNGAQ